MNNRWVGDESPFGGHAFGVPSRMALPSAPSPKVGNPRLPDRVEEARSQLQSIERNRIALERAIGPDATITALEQALSNFEDALSDAGA